MPTRSQSERLLVPSISMLVKPVVALLEALPKDGGNLCTDQDDTMS